jgi:hypothetical protein
MLAHASPFHRSLRTLPQLRPLQEENIKLRTELQTTREILQNRINDLTEELGAIRKRANQELRELYRGIAKLEARVERVSRFTQSAMNCMILKGVKQ